MLIVLALALASTAAEPRHSGCAAERNVDPPSDALWRWSTSDANGAHSRFCPDTIAFPLTVAWETRPLPIGEYDGPEVAAGRVVYVRAADGVAAVDAGTGAVRWSSPGNAGYSSWLADPGGVDYYSAADSGTLRRVDASSGRLVFALPLGPTVTDPPLLALPDGRALTCRAPATGLASLLEIDRTDGQVVAEQPISLPPSSFVGDLVPTRLLAVSGKTGGVCVTGDRGIAVYRRAADPGARRRAWALGAVGNVAPAITAGGDTILAFWSPTLTAYDIHLNRRWSIDLPLPRRTEPGDVYPAATDGRVCVLSDWRRVWCVRLRDGRIVWTRKLRNTLLYSAPQLLIAGGSAIVPDASRPGGPLNRLVALGLANGKTSGTIVLGGQIGTLIADGRSLYVSVFRDRGNAPVGQVYKLAPHAVRR